MVNPSHRANSSNPKSEIPPKKDKPEKNPTDQKANEVGGGFFSNLRDAGAAFIAGQVSKRYKGPDKAFLQQLTGKDLSLELQEIVPQLPIAIREFLPNTIATIAKKQQKTAEIATEALILHVIANMAANIYPEQKEAIRQGHSFNKVPVEELTEKITTHVMNMLATGFEHIDQSIQSESDITLEQFTPLAHALLGFMLTQENGLWANGERRIGAAFSKDLANGLMQMYKPFGIWLAGGELKFSESGHIKKFIPLLEKFGAYVANCMANSHRQQDQVLLKGLTGKDDVQDLVALLSPTIVNGILANEDVVQFLNSLLPQPEEELQPEPVEEVTANPNDREEVPANETKAETPLNEAEKFLQRNNTTINNVSSALVLKVIANASREIFKKEIANKEVIPVDEFVKKFTRGVSNIFGTYIRELNQKENPQKEDFQGLAKHLLGIALPENPILQSFLDRRTDQLTDKLSSVLEKSYKSIMVRNDTEIYKERLKRLLSETMAEEQSNENEIDKLVDQLFNLCCNITNMGRGFVAERLSDPKVLENQFIATLSESHEIPVGLFEGVARGISQLIGQDHQVSSPEVIRECLKDIDPGVIDDLRDSIADTVERMSKTGTISDPKVLIQRLNKKKNFRKLDQSVKEKIAEKVIQALYDDNPMYWLTPTIQNALQITLFKGLVHLLEKAQQHKLKQSEEQEEKPGTQEQGLFESALQLLLDASKAEYDELLKGIRAYNDPTSEFYKANKEERKACIKLLEDKYIEEFANKLVTIFYEDTKEGGTTLKDHIPLPAPANEKVAELIKKNAHKVLGPMIETSTSWINAKKENAERLRKTFTKKGKPINHHAPEACRVIGALAGQAIPPSLQENHEQLAKKVSKHLAFLFASQSGKAPSEEQLATLTQMIDNALLGLSHNETPAMQAFLKFLEHFTEAALLRCLADLTECLASLNKKLEDDEHGPLLVQGATLLLQELRDHLTLMSEVKEENKEYRAGKIPTGVYVEKFKDADHLHEAFGNQEEKDAFFVTFAKRFLKIVGVSEVVNLPIPEFLKAPLWNLIETEMMPLMLNILFEQVKDPNTLTLILLSIFKQINAANNGTVDVSLPNDKLKKFVDQPQAHIEEISGELVKALVQLQRSTITKKALGREDIRKYVGEAVGQPLREILQNRSIIEVIDEMIVSLIPTLYPYGAWNDEGRFNCDEDGNELPIDFSFMFPRTEEAKKKYAKQKVKEAKRAEKETVQEITHAIENQIKYIFLRFFRKIWNSFKGLLDKIFDIIFRKYSGPVKKVVNAILDGFADYFIKPVLFIATFPVLFIVKRLLRFYFVHQSKQRTADVKHEIHENIFYRLINSMLTLVEEADKKSKAEENPPAEATPEESA